MGSHGGSSSGSHTQRNGNQFQSKHIYYSSAIKNLKRNNGKQGGGGEDSGAGENCHQTAAIDRKAWKKSLMD